MMNGKKVFRLVISAFLLVAIVATCVGVYQSANKSGNEGKKLAEGTPLQEEHLATNDDQSETEDETKDVGTNSVEGTKETEDKKDDSASAQEDVQNNNEAEQPQQEAAVSDDVVSEQAEPAAPTIDFTEESLMGWPVNGEIVLDYSMDHTIYFPTLDVYKYNPSIVIKSEVNTPVNAVANGQVLSVINNEETGTTVTLDMGNGYQAVYGQLKEVAFEEGNMIEEGTVIGYVSEPTKYYSKEGTNLYFALTKDGNSLDPMMYLP